MRLVLVILVVGAALSRCFVLAMTFVDPYLAGRRAKLAAYAEMDRRFPPPPLTSGTDAEP